MGHVIGFNHSSNMTYSTTIDGKRTGFYTVTNRIMNVFFDNDLFPISSNNYYMTSDIK
ncbi:MAG: hypothetical protein ACK5MD_02640 [Flavobacteriales bacterium]